jgi:thioredoxin reductase (NADPH)
MIIRSDKMRASKIMQERVLANDKIQIFWNSSTEEILGQSVVEGAIIVNSKTNEKTTLKVTGFFVAIGHQPQSSIFKDFITCDEEGYVITQPDSTKTNVEGVFAAGDLQDKHYRQAVTAAGSGCMAALDAERYLSAKGVI